MVYCTLCGDKTDLDYPGLCSRCLEDLKKLRDDYDLCDLCGNFYPRSFYSCPQCFAAKSPKAYRRATAVFPYEDKAKKLVLDLKFHNGGYLAEPMAKLILTYEDISEGGLYTHLIPVPMSPERFKERQYNQSELLCKEISYLTGLPYLRKTLVKVRDTPSQATLPAEARKSNLKDSFKVEDPQAVAGKYVILVDDVITTGSTAQECAKTLKAAGAAGIKVLAFCGTTSV